jgi:hypothetical protein
VTPGRGALAVGVSQRVLGRSGVGGNEVRELLERLGDGSAGQVLLLAGENRRL